MLAANPFSPEMMKFLLPLINFKILPDMDTIRQNSTEKWLMTRNLAH